MLLQRAVRDSELLEDGNYVSFLSVVLLPSEVPGVQKIVSV